MKILVDKLPTTPEECLFCLQGRDGYHRCGFHLEPYDFHGGLTTTYRDCALRKDQECPYLKEANNG